jgi:hypothetical protein
LPENMLAYLSRLSRPIHDRPRDSYRDP